MQLVIEMMEVRRPPWRFRTTIYFFIYFFIDKTKKVYSNSETQKLA